MLKIAIDFLKIYKKKIDKLPDYKKQSIEDK